MELPKPLASWQELLGAFPDDIAGLMASLVNQLSPLIQNNPLDNFDGDIEPDGFNGLTRDANYERLLLTEWALQEECPDEFIRRAITGEHLFLEPQRKENREDRTCYALFDCGPEQLGRPRLVQLATLILLARRADKHKLRFKWGVLQDANFVWQEGLSKDSVLLWLKQRSHMLVSQDILDAWMASLLSDMEEEQNRSIGVSELPSLVQDLWLVTKSPLNKPVDVSRLVSIDEPILDPDSISVSIAFNKSTRSLSLTLTDEDLNVRILRNPFSESKKALISAKWDESGSWVSSANGRRLACLNNDGKLSIHAINEKPSKKHQSPGFFDVPEGQQCIGVFLTKKRSVILCVDKGHFYFHNSPQYGQVKTVDKKQSIPFGGDNAALLSIVIGQSESGTAKLFLLDTKGQLRTLGLEDDLALFKTEDDNVIALGQTITCEYSVRFEREQNCLTVQWYLASSQPSSREFKINYSQEKPAIFVHGSGPWHKGSVGCFAYENDDNMWAVVAGPENNTVEVEECDRVVGVMHVSENLVGFSESKTKKMPVLVVMKPDDKSVFAVWSGGEYCLISLTSEFESGQLNPRYGYLQYVNSAKEMIVVNLLGGDELLRLANGGAV